MKGFWVGFRSFEFGVCVGFIGPPKKHVNKNKDRDIPYKPPYKNNKVGISFQNAYASVLFGSLSLGSPDLWVGAAGTRMGEATKACAGPAAEAATEPAPLAMTQTGGWLDFQMLRGRARV